MSQKPLRGRAASSNPANRFEKIEYVPDPEALEAERYDEDGPRRQAATEFFRDNSKTLLVRNESPDVRFDVGLNPYRGCEHGCIYCFARQHHEFLGLSAGLDFETKIFVKENAPELLRAELSSPKWKPEPIGMSGVTDPYQPIERKFNLTGRCLEVLAEFRNPVIVITKNHLVTRDVDSLAELARHNACAVAISVTTLEPDIGRRMEPRTSSPAKRLDAIRALTDAGVPVGVLVAPVVPGLTDHEIPAIVDACARAGARFASYIMLRLPHGIADLFDAWLQENFPEHRDKVLSRVRSVREGKLYKSGFGTRQTGTGVFAEHTKAMFEMAVKRAGLSRGGMKLSTAAFRRGGDQLSMFDS